MARLLRSKVRNGTSNSNRKWRGIELFSGSGPKITPPGRCMDNGCWCQRESKRK